MQISKLYGIHVKELLGLKENAERWPGLTRYSWFQPKTFVEVPALLPSEESTQEPEETATVGQPASSRWSDKEKEAFVRLIQQEVGRQTKPSLIPWTSMTSKFLELTGVQRSKESLRNFYQRHWNELGLPSPFSRSGGRGQPTDEKRAVAAGKTASRSKASRPTQKIAAAVVAAPAASEKKGPGTFGRAVAAGKTAPRATASRRRQKIGAAAAPASKTKGREKFGRAAATVAAAAAGITATASDKEEAKEMDRARYTVRSAQRYAAATAAAAAASESKKNKDVAMKRIAVAAAAAAATEKKKKKKKVTEMERAAAIVTAAAAASEKKKKKDMAMRTAAATAVPKRDKAKVTKTSFTTTKKKNTASAANKTTRRSAPSAFQKGDASINTKLKNIVTRLVKKAHEDELISLSDLAAEVDTAYESKWGRRGGHRGGRSGARSMTSSDFSSLGFEVKEFTMCKVCNMRASKEQCADHYIPRAKVWPSTMTKRKMIVGVVRR